ncbi:copper resistance CopC family protein [Rothia endophytica]|uniref:copper resistance CopC family protein n=1 Tax=Rothia endophytica TaxID=1324766 RepID=UPI001F2C329B|nr:copper resistance CopC family protein [Rothia endophytica]
MADAKKRALSALTRTAAATSLLALTLGFAPAHAHDELVSTNPAANTTLDQAPKELELTYSGEIMDVAGANQVRVTNAAGETVTEGEPEVDGTVVTQDLAAQETDDTYTVTWRVVSSDGHPIQGTFTYTVGEGAAQSSEPTSTDAGEQQDQPAEPITAASQGMSTGAKVALFLVAAAAIMGALFVVLTKTKKRK